MYIPPRTGTGYPTGICLRSGKGGDNPYQTILSQVPQPTYGRSKWVGEPYQTIPYLARGVTDGFTILDSVPDPVVAE